MKSTAESPRVHSVTAVVPRRRIAAVTALLLGLLAWAAPAAAQLGRIGTNPTVVAAFVRGSDDAYDPSHDIYLVVGAYGPVYGVFVNVFGDPITAPFRINNDGAGFAHFPRVVYSQHVSNGAGGTGGFLVTWHENIGLPNYVHTRVVAYPNRLVTPVNVIDSSATWWESGASMAYSPSSQMFFVAWRSANTVVWGARIGLDGRQIGSLTQISAGAESRDPSVAWNPHTNEFGVVYTGWNSSGVCTATFARVNTAGNVPSRALLGTAAGTFITDLAMNPVSNRFIAVWHAQGIGTVGAEIDAAGTPLTTGLVSTVVGTLDGLGLSYNPVSGTFLVVGQSSLGPDIWASELNARGARTSGEVIITSTGGDAYYPRAGARMDAAQWDISFAGPGYASLRDQVVSTTSVGGGPAGSLGGAPPSSGDSSGGSSGGCPGTQPFPGAICVNGGWVPGDSGSGGSTGGCPGTQPFPGAICVNGGWVPGDSGSDGSTGGSTGGCPGTQPFPGAICVNGGWVPGDTSSGGSTGGCPGTQPFPGAICVNGGWVPGDTSSGGSTSTGGCPGTQPFPGAICVNGGWIPGDSGSGGSTSTGGCPGTQPFPGAICVNGGWIPGDSTSSSGTISDGSCTTPDPFVAIGGGICSNGGWVPLQ
jgi:hypothetical protein